MKPNLSHHRGQLEGRRRREADIRFGYYGRPGPGHAIHRVHGPFDEVEKAVGSALGRQTMKPGTVVALASHTGERGEIIIGLAPPGQLGASDFGFPQPTGRVVDALGIISADPAELESGATAEPVTLTGFGFRQSPVDVVRAVLWNETTKVWDADPLITVGVVTWTSATQISVPITVSWTAPDGYLIALEIVRG